MDIDVTKIMESIRISARNEGIVQPVKEIPAFSEAFLHPIKSNGKSFELGMMIGYKIKTMTPFTDAELAPVMLKNKKLPFIPSKVKNKKRIRQIFDRAEYFQQKKVTKKKDH